MDGSANLASIVIAISMGVSLLAGFFSVSVAMRSRKDAIVNRDTTVSMLFGIALLLIMLYVTAGARIAVWGLTYVGMLKAALLLTAAFAVAGMVFGLKRGLRSGRATKTQNA